MGRTVRETSVIDVDADRLWTEINLPRLLLYVAQPVVHFRIETPLRIERPQPYETVRHLFDRGSSRSIPIWHHLLSVERLSKNRARYADEVTIDAGFKTPLIAMFARVFFRHRQRRLKRLAENGFAYR